MRTLFGILAAATVALSIASPAKADLITNGGFETGDFTGWIHGGNLGDTSVGSFPIAPNSGSFAAELGPIGSDGTLSQTITTVVGDVYQLNYFHIYALGDNTPDDWSVSFDGMLLQSEANVSTPQTWTQYTFDVTAVDTSATLLFAFRDDPSFQGLDDVSLVDLGPATSVPEPASLALLASGLIALGLITRRKPARLPVD